MSKERDLLSLQIATFFDLTYGLGWAESTDISEDAAASIGLDIARLRDDAKRFVGDLGIAGRPPWETDSGVRDLFYTAEPAWFVTRWSGPAAMYEAVQFKAGLERCQCYAARMDALCVGGCETYDTETATSELTRLLGFPLRHRHYVAAALYMSDWRTAENWGNEFAVLRMEVKKFIWQAKEDGRRWSDGRRDEALQMGDEDQFIEPLYASGNSLVRIDWPSVAKKAGLTDHEQMFMLDYLSKQANSKTDPTAWKAITGKNRSKRTRLVAQIRRHRIMPGVLREFPTNEHGERTGGAFFTHLRTSADDRFPYKEFYP